MKKFIVPIISLVGILFCCYSIYSNLKPVVIEDLPFEYLSINEIENILMDKYNLDDIQLSENYTIYPDNDCIYEHRIYEFYVQDKQFDCIVSCYLKQDNIGLYYFDQVVHDNYLMNKSIELIEGFHGFEDILDDIYYFDHVLLEFESFDNFKYKLSLVSYFYDYLESIGITYGIPFKFVSPSIAYVDNYLVTSNVEDMFVNGFYCNDVNDMIVIYCSFLLDNGLFYNESLELTNGNYSFYYDTNICFPVLFYNLDDDKYYYDMYVCNYTPTNLYTVFNKLGYNINGSIYDFSVEVNGDIHSFVLEGGSNPFNRHQEMSELLGLSNYNHAYSYDVEFNEYKYYINDIEQLGGINLLDSDYLLDTFNIYPFILEETLENNNFDILDFEVYIKELDLELYNQIIKN